MNDPKPRRQTAERILDVTLGLFNRLGEPNVSTSHLCREMGISPGNLFYHHASRDALVLGLYLRYDRAVDVALALHATASARHPQEAAPDAAGTTPTLARLTQLCMAVAQCARAHRFLFRDLSDLVSRHRELERRLPHLLKRQSDALSQALASVVPGLQGEGPTGQATVGFMLASLTGSVALDGALDPRERVRSTDARAVGLSVARALALVAPWLEETPRRGLRIHLNEGERLGADPWCLQSVDA